MADTKICYQCRSEVNSLAKLCPHCRTKLGGRDAKTGLAKRYTTPAAWMGLGCGGLVLVGMIIGMLQGGGSSPTTHASGGVAVSAKDDLDLFLKRYGAPDVDDTTLHDNPPPPIVTRWLVYKKEGVKAMYGYENDGTWKLMGFLDARTKQVLKPENVVQRMQKRDRGLPK